MVKYNPIASISGDTTAGARSIQLLIVLKRHLPYDDARAAALGAAKDWTGGQAKRKNNQTGLRDHPGFTLERSFRPQAVSLKCVRLFIVYVS